MVAARMGRQAILDKAKPPTLWVVLDEVVLHRVVGGTSVMREQLSRLAEAARCPNVVIQIIPTSTGAHQGLNGGAFIVADLRARVAWHTRTRPCRARSSSRPKGSRPSSFSGIRSRLRRFPGPPRWNLSRK